MLFQAVLGVVERHHCTSGRVAGLDHDRRCRNMQHDQQAKLKVIDGVLHILACASEMDVSETGSMLLPDSMREDVESRRKVSAREAFATGRSCHRIPDRLAGFLGV